MTMTAPVITIDGPSGVGKGTLCRSLAEILQWHFLDSGVIYRALGLSALHHQMIINNEKDLIFLATQLDIHFLIKKNKINIILEGKDVSQIIRNEVISKTASQIAIFPGVRKALLHRQRTFHVAPGLIADGRDMGTVVFPNAPIKIFLDASSEERAYRRMRQLQKKGFNVSFSAILSEMKKRDASDRNRTFSPLVPATDALVLDSTYLSIDEVTEKVLSHARQILMLSYY